MIGRRTNEPVAYGIDFGTTNSSIAVAYRGPD
jgi:molecular chaperone DnaK (HSP70)